MNQEHPLVVALCWALTGLLFAFYLLIQLGALGSTGVDLTSDAELTSVE